ncbi:MAG TPA: TIM barrel protein, partial [Candidatus Sulfotelmatobacter sp.]|nr:TIM barrel protein [Candidatus Sulfotelmatobacter sp.]
GIQILIEPINQRDMPGYFLSRQDEGQAICREVGAPNLRVQFDCYHCQIVEGDLAMKLKRDIAGIGHIQIAGVPERHEPDLGELNYPYLFALIDALSAAT